MKAWSWLTDSLHRLQPATRPSRAAGQFALDAARGERLSCQLGVRVAGNDRPVAVSVSCRPAAGLSVRVRRVGYVPVPHHNTPLLAGHHEGSLPGYVGDPLFDEPSGQLWNGETNAFWLTIDVGRACRAGERKVRVVVDVGGQRRAHELLVRVHGVTLRRRRNFPVTHWFYADALCDRYAVRPWSGPFWAIVERYIRDVAAHGQDTLYVPVFTPPLDGVKRPTQLLKVTRPRPGRYSFDFADVRKWIRLAGRCGIRNFEFNHLFTQWGVANAIRIYRGQGFDEQLLWLPSTPATGGTYRTFLAAYLPALESFCRREGIGGRSFFHVSDEPHGREHLDNYARARRMLAELAPWMKVMDALSEVEFAREGLVDMPVASIRAVRDFIAAGIPCWAYYACGPRGKYLNRQMDTPLSKIRMSGWLFHRTGVRGFLHWGYNYWYKSQTRQMIDPYTVSDGLAGPGWAHGDTFQVYPGPDGPIDSVRWEVFAESLQDYALLQTLGVEPGEKLLAAVRDYDDFPFSPAWVAAARRKLLARV